MNQIKIKRKFMIHYIINIVVNYLFVKLYFDWIEFDISLVAFALVIVVSSLSIIIWRIFFKKPVLIPIILAILGIIISYLRFYQIELYNQLMGRIQDFLEWSTRFIAGFTFEYITYFFVLIGLIIFLGTLITSTLVFSIKKVAPLLVAGTLVFMYSWFNYIDKAIYYYVIYLLAILILYSLRRYTEIEDNWNCSGKVLDSNIMRGWIIYSSIVCLLLVVFAFLLPHNIKPISWPWLDNQVQSTFPELYEWRNEKKASKNYGELLRFDLTSTQYQENIKRLGGPVETRDILVMRVESQEPAYLKGRVSDFYTGSYWKTSKDIISNQYSSNDNTLLKNENIDGVEIVQKITHLNLVTSTIFSSYYPRRVQIENSYYYSTDELELFSDRIIDKGMTYIVRSIKPYIDWSVVLNSKYEPTKDYEKYLQVPDSVPDRVKDLAHSITENYDSDYHKTKALEDYLRNNYRYTLAPEETPYNRDFVDYFLFDAQEGYCTYFASSLAIMARSIGIPTRYVEGFRTPDIKEGEAYYVYDKNAHAWVEVYIEGQGWIIFEPTATYENIDYEENEIEENIIEEEKGLDDSISNRLQNDSLNHQLELDDILGTPDDSIDMQTNSISHVFKKLLVLILSSVVFLIVFHTYKYNKDLKKFKIGTKNDFIIRYYSYIMNLLNLIDIEKYDHETTNEFSKRLASNPWESDVSFMEITEIFNIARYSHQQADDHKVKIVENYSLTLEKYIKKESNIIRFMISKYIARSLFK